MPGTIEERVAYLEGKVEEHSRAWVDLKDSINHVDQRITFLDQKVDRFRDELSGRIDSLDQKLSARIDNLDQKVDRFRDELSARITDLDNRLNARINSLDQKVDRFRDELSARINSLDQKMSKFTLWIIGIQVTTFMAMIAVFLRVAGR